MRTMAGVCCVLLLAAASAGAATPAGPGLDLLILVDRSGSMRSHSPAVIVDALPLALNAMTWSARTAHVQHRFGVVSFGSDVKIDVPLTLLDAKAFPSLRTRVGALSSRSLGNTDFVRAFEAAAEAFRALPRDPQRRRAVLLVTDGRSAMPGSRAMIDRAMAASLHRTGASVHVLLFGEEDPSAWNLLSDHRVHRVQSDRADVLATIHRVIGELTGTRTTQDIASDQEHTVILPPYLEVVVFDVVRDERVRDVSVFAPGASKPLDSQTSGVEEVNVGDVLSTVVVRRPAAGAWTFRPSDSRLGGGARARVLSQQFFPRGALVEPHAVVRPHHAVTLHYRLEDGTGHPLRELPGYPLSVDVSVAMPDGNRFVLPMSTPRQSSGLYRAGSMTKCDAEGRYWTEVVVVTADSSGRPLRIFEDRWSGFSVEAAPVLRASATPSPKTMVPSPVSYGVLAVLVPVVALAFLLVRRR